MYTDFFFYSQTDLLQNQNKFSLFLQKTAFLFHVQFQTNTSFYTFPNMQNQELLYNILFMRWGIMKYNSVIHPHIILLWSVHVVIPCLTTHTIPTLLHGTSIALSINNACSCTSHLCHQQHVSRYYFQLLADEVGMARGFLGIIRRFGWKRVGIITQNENLFTVVSHRLTQQCTHIKQHFYGKWEGLKPVQCALTIGRLDCYMYTCILRQGMDT